MVSYFCSLVQLCCGEGGALQTNVTGVCEECSQCLGHSGFAPAHGVRAFPVYTAQAPGCSAGELSTVGPGLRALPRSKPLRFRFLGSPQGRSWLGLHLVPFPGPSSSVDQVLGQRTVPQWAVRLISSSVPATQFPQLAVGVPLRHALCLLWEMISDCNPPGGCQPSRIPGRLG